jgi:hypothetical protein
MLRGFMQNHAGLNLLSCYKPVREADEADQPLVAFSSQFSVRSPTGFIPPWRLLGAKHGVEVAVPAGWWTLG